MTGSPPTARRFWLTEVTTASAVVVMATAVASAGEAVAFAAVGPLGVLASAGYVLRHLFLPGVLAVVAARALVRSWRLGALVRSWTRPDGAAPRLVAWLVWALLAAWSLALCLLFASERLLAATRAPKTVSLAVMAGGLVLFAAAVALTPAIVRGLERVAARLPVSPRRAAWAFAVAAVGSAAAADRLIVRPRVGHLELSLLPFAGAWMAVCVAGYWAARRLESRRKLVAAGAVALVGLLSVGAARYSLAERLDVVLSVWGDAPVGGRAIERSHDLYALRDRVGLTTVAPVATAERHPNVVLITVDTVRADRTPLVGGPASMPALESLARAGSSFEWALASSNVTRRSIPALVTGASPFRVRGRVAGWALRLDPRHVLLAERFAAAGYETAGFACCESFFAERHRLGWIRGLDSVFLDRDGAKLAGRALDWMRARDRDGGRPYFVWLHLIEPHEWEQEFPAREYRGESNRRRYDRGLNAADRALSPLLRHLTSSASVARTVVALTSDHGEGLGDHAAAYHATDLYNSQLRVPLVLAGPGVARGARIRAPVGLVDVGPTLLELAGYRPPEMPSMDGRSFAALVDADPLNDGPAPGEAYSVMVEDRSVPRSRWALLYGRHKLIALDGRPGDDPGDVELYDVRADPNELTNLAPQQPALVQQLLERLRARREVDAVPAF